jgi:hypothetical protein
MSPQGEHRRATQEGRPLTASEDAVALESAIGLVWGLLDAGRIAPAETLVTAALRLWPNSTELRVLAAAVALAASRPDALDELVLPVGHRWQALLQPLLARASRLAATGA